MSLVRSLLELFRRKNVTKQPKNKKKENPAALNLTPESELPAQQPDPGLPAPNTKPAWIPQFISVPEPRKAPSWIFFRPLDDQIKVGILDQLGNRNQEEPAPIDNEVLLAEFVNVDDDIYGGGEPSEECGCCFDDATPFEEMVQCPDGHLFCPACVQHLVETVVGDNGTVCVVSTL